MVLIVQTIDENFKNHNLIKFIFAGKNGKAGGAWLVNYQNV